jgi:fused signal recognition particle receptor
LIVITHSCLSKKLTGKLLEIEIIMFNWFRRSKEENKQTPNLPEQKIPETQPLPSTEVDPELMWSVKVLADQGRQREEMATEELDWLQRLRQGLDKSRRELSNQLKGIVGQGPLTTKAIADIETLLLQADVGVEATDYIINKLETQVREKSLPSNEAFDYLKTLLCEILERPLKYNAK